MRHHPDDLITIFNDCFLKTYNTILAYGDNEPLYLPANNERPHHTIYFAHGFFRSALHECAHWMIASEARRQQEDYGYWYMPDGRDSQQQLLFEQVEVKPQALEWIFSQACHIKFDVSFDNLNGAPGNIDQFKRDVTDQMQRYKNDTLPRRANIFYQALRERFSNV